MNDKVKYIYQFTIKSKEELRGLTHKELLEYIENLQDNIISEKPQKNSNNSSIPTSKEIVPPKKKKNQSLRKSGGKNGGVFGHKGVTLQQSDTPDEIIDIDITQLVSNISS